MFIGMRTRAIFLLSVWALHAVLLVGCDPEPQEAPPSPSPPPPATGDRIDFELGPRTRQLDDADLAALAPGADTSQVLRFHAAVGERFAVGDVLLAGVSPGTPRGLLRVVVATTRVGDTIELQTEQAPLQLAFLKLDVHVERPLDTPLALPAPLQTQAFALGFLEGGQTTVDRFFFNGDEDESSLEDQYAIHDEFTGVLGVTLDIQFEWGFAEDLVAGVDAFAECAAATFTLGVVGDCPDLDMPVLSATFRAQSLLAMRFDHEGAATIPFATGPVAVGEKRQLPAITIGPLVFIPELGFVGEAKGSAGSYMRVAGSSQVGFDVEVTASTETGFDTSAPSPLPQVQIDEVAAFLDGRVETSVGPTLEMLAYGAIGPRFGFAFRSEVDVDRTRAAADCYRAIVGIDATFGFVIRLPWRAIGEKLSGSTEVGEAVQDVAAYFGLDGDLLNEGRALEIAAEQLEAGACSIPPPEMLPPGAPQDDTLANRPSRRGPPATTKRATTSTSRRRRTRRALC